jgi:hypothetical protein
MKYILEKAEKQLFPNRTITGRKGQGSTSMRPLGNNERRLRLLVAFALT